MAEYSDEETTEEGQAIGLEEEDDSEEEDKPLEYDIESENLVTELKASRKGQEALKKLADHVLMHFDEAWDAASEYRERAARNWRLFAGELPPKNGPMQNAANLHLPIMLENVCRLTFRSYGELFGDWTAVFEVLPTGPDDKVKAEMLTLHTNWQLAENTPDFKRQQMRGLLAFFTTGDVVFHSYWDDAKKRNVHEMLTPDNFVVPYTSVSVQPDFSDCPWVAKVLELQKSDLEARMEVWENIKEVLTWTPDINEEPEQSISDTVSEVQETHKYDNQISPYKLIWWEGWYELPNEKRQRFLKVIVHRETRKVVLAVLHEEPNWQDELRYQRQIQEMEEYIAGMEAYEQAQAMPPEPMAPPGLEPPGQMPGMPPAPPEPPLQPEWMQEGKTEPDPPRMEPIHMFSHAVCIEPFHGVYGLGYGRIQADHNRAANTMLNQFVDQATLANIGSWIAPAGLKFTSKFSMGKINFARGFDAKNAANLLTPLQSSAASPQLFEAIRLMQVSSQDSMQAPQVLSGAEGKSGETWRGHANRVEQATKQLSVVTRNYGELLTHIARNNARLNAAFLDDYEVVSITDHIARKVRQIFVSRQLYQRDYRVTIRADLRFASKQQKIQEADELLNMATMIPYLFHNPPYMYAVMRQVLETRNRHDLIQYLGEPPKAAPWGFVPPSMQMQIAPQPQAPPGTQQGGAPPEAPAAE